MQLYWNFFPILTERFGVHLTGKSSGVGAKDKTLTKLLSFVVCDKPHITSAHQSKVNLRPIFPNKSHLYTIFITLFRQSVSSFSLKLPVICFVYT